LASKLPRNSIRLRLTFLYSGLFLVCGVTLLGITYGLVSGSGGPLVAFRYQSVGTSGQSVPQSSGVQPLPALTSLPRAYAAASHAAELHQLLVYFSIALGIMVVASVALGWLMAGRVLRPLRTITSSVRDISATNLHERLSLEGPDDELKELAGTFNKLLNRLEGAFDAQRQFVANASHELRTPLTRERTVMEVALRDPGATIESLREAGLRVIASAEQQERLIEALLTLARSQRGLDRHERFDLSELAAAVAAARKPDADRAQLQMRLTLQPAAASGDGRLAERLVANLIDNAIRHNLAGGELIIATRNVGGRGVIEVANTGPQIPETALPELTQPFRRLPGGRASQADPPGLGLGLAIVDAIAAAHDARLELRARPGGGLVATVTYPAG
jgi:signal transduction histidine kinase